MVRHSFWSVSILWNWPTPNRVLEPLLHGTNMFCQDNHQSSLYFHVPDKLNFQTSSTGIAAVLVAVCTRQSVETPCKGGSLMLRFFWSYLWPAVLSHATKICANHIAWGHAYSWIADQRHAHKKINLPTNQKDYNTFKTTIGKLSARRIQIFPFFLFRHYFESYIE